MKKFILALSILAIFVAVIPAQAEIPADKQYIIKMAAYSIAIDIRNEDPATANHYERIMLANRVISSPGSAANKIAEIAEAANYGTAIIWDTVTDANIKNAMSGVWNHVALATYGPDPVRPE